MAELLVDRYLNSYLYSNALTLATVLYNEEPLNPERLWILANVHVRRREFKAAAELLKGNDTPRNRYLRAFCCLNLGNLQEAEAALLPRMGSRDEDATVPNGAGGYHMLGVICQRANRTEQAIVYFRESLRLDPLMFDSMKALCDLGVPSVEALLNVSPAAAAASHAALEKLQQQHTHQEGLNQHSSTVTRTSTNDSSHVINGAAGGGSSGVGAGAGFVPNKATGSSRSGGRGIPSYATPVSHQPNGSETSNACNETTESVSFASSAAPPKVLNFDTPNMTPITAGGDPRADHIPIGGASAYHSQSAVKKQQMFSEAQEMGVSSIAVSPELGRELFSKDGGKPAKLYKTSGKGADVGRVFDGSGGHPLHRRVTDSSSVCSQVVVAVMSVVSRAYHHICHHRGRRALSALHQLPAKHFHTGFVQHLVGKCYFEMAQYSKAKTALEHMQKLAPYRMQGLELLSTALWQLNRKVDLCYLTQRVTAFDKTSPEVWCVVGNCFSLQKEHEAALKFFQRAIQMDPEFTYAYTLCAHEYVANEDFEKAICMFRKAIQTNSRHYNAWYGLGSIYLRQEKFSLAEYHYRKALAINPQNPVLYCQLGNVLHKTKNCEEALEMLRIASEMAPDNPTVRYTRADVLESMAAVLTDERLQILKYEEALRELEIVRTHVPKEAQVHFKAGAICKKLGRKDEALRYFTFAYDLDPKDNNQIKNALERLEQDDVEEDSF